jgi:hypothetical protein
MHWSITAAAKAAAVALVLTIETVQTETAIQNRTSTVSARQDEY